MVIKKFILICIADNSISAVFQYFFSSVIGQYQKQAIDNENADEYTLKKREYKAWEIRQSDLAKENNNPTNLLYQTFFVVRNLF